MLKLIEQLLKEGRGFNLQSHGTSNGADFYNFALYPAPGTKGSSHYIHGHDLDEIVSKVRDVMSESPVLTVETLRKAKESIPAFAPIPTMPMMPLPPMGH